MDKDVTCSRQLTPFQVRCEAAAVSALAAAGSGLADRAMVEGHGETFVRARIRGLDAELFVHEDEAAIQGPGVDERFEAPDFSSPERLIEVLAQKLRAFVAENTGAP